MIGMKNNSPKDGELNSEHQNISPKGWQYKNNSPKDGESNSKHKDNSSKGWTVQK